MCPNVRVKGKGSLFLSKMVSVAGSTEIAATIPDRCNPIISVSEQYSPCRESLNKFYIAACACQLHDSSVEGQDQLQRWLLLVLLHACVRSLLVVVDLQELAQAISVCWPGLAAFVLQDLW